MGNLGIGSRTKLGSLLDFLQDALDLFLVRGGSRSQHTGCFIWKNMLGRKRLVEH